ncbi:MAG: bacillithiol biosynthesis deacetylase BshB1 [Planctomycetes bacterium]|nr:bacillithiol biosynthesis deacetylase BshB1 [Planctomycetota bacterium]
MPPHDGLDVLAFGAHPDDVELGCGGTMLKFADAGLRLGVVDLSAGERGSRGDRATRADEARAAGVMMQLAVRETLGFADTELVASLEMRRAVVAAIRRHRPRIVLSPLPHDLHPDHAAAGAAVRDAMYPAGMRNLDVAGEPWRPTRLFHYFMHDEEETPLVNDVTDVWERRLALARCFGSQLHVPTAAGTDTAPAHPTMISRPDFLMRIEARARAWGRRAGVELGEPLVVAGALPVCDVAALFAAGRV